MVCNFFIFFFFLINRGDGMWCIRWFSDIFISSLEYFFFKWMISRLESSLSRELIFLRNDVFFVIRFFVIFFVSFSWRVVFFRWFFALAIRLDIIFFSLLRMFLFVLLKKNLINLKFWLLSFILVFKFNFCI